MVVFGVKAAMLDPTDPAIYILYSRNIDLDKQCKLRDMLEELCNTCLSKVQVTSRHCNRCNRCCDHMDHHCKWLNNCIGKLNYPHFIASSVFFMFYEVLILGFAVYLLITFKDPEMVAIGSILIAFNLVALLSILALLLFHCYIWFIG